MNEDALILKEYGEAFRKYAKDGIIDMDDRLKHKFNFQVHRLEDFVQELRGVVPPYRQSQYFIVLVKHGTGEKTVGHFHFPICDHTLIIIPKRVNNSSRYWSTDCSGYYLSFNIEFFLQNVFPKQHIVDKMIFKHTVRPYLVLSEQQVDKLVEIFEYLMREHKDEKMRKDEMLAIKVLEMIVLCDRFFTDAAMLKQENIYSSVVERFNDLIQKNHSKERTVAFYAKALNMHPNHLNALVKKYTGLTAKETINDYILTEAQSLLHSSELTIKEIAYQLGFTDPDQFSTFFRKRVSASPRQYRLNPS
jgi:AraC family transcriptional activator of pobA